jgi:hypothetical protein
MNLHERLPERARMTLMFHNLKTRRFPHLCEDEPRMQQPIDCPRHVLVPPPVLREPASGRMRKGEDGSSKMSCSILSRRLSKANAMRLPRAVSSESFLWPDAPRPSFAETRPRMQQPIDCPRHLLLPPPVLREPEAGGVRRDEDVGSQKPSSVLSRRLAQENALRLSRAASSESFLSPWNVDNAQAYVRGAPSSRTTASTRRSVVPSQGPNRGHGSATVDSISCQVDTVSRTIPVDSLSTNREGAALTGSSKIVHKLRTTLKKTTNFGILSESLMSSADSLRSQMMRDFIMEIRSAYEACDSHARKSRSRRTYLTTAFPRVRM